MTIYLNIDTHEFLEWNIICTLKLSGPHTLHFQELKDMPCFWKLPTDTHLQSYSISIGEQNLHWHTKNLLRAWVFLLYCNLLTYHEKQLALTSKIRVQMLAAFDVINGCTYKMWFSDFKIKWTTFYSKNMALQIVSSLEYKRYFPHN